MGAAVVAMIVNAAMLVPVYRAHHVGAGIVDVAVCSDHLIGGYSQGDRIRFGLPLEHRPTTVLDDAKLVELGFSAADLAQIGDTTPMRRFPPSRPAWVRLIQAVDSMRPWRVEAVGSRRDDVAGAGLVVKARVDIVSSVWVAEEPVRVAATVRRTEPHSLYLRDDEAAGLRGLRVGAPRCITTLRLGNGTDGSVWVDSVP
jgi:hypothetical protein